MSVKWSLGKADKALVLLPVALRFLKYYPARSAEVCAKIA